MTNQEMPGARFGKLTVVGDSGQREGKSILWRCGCDCGNEILLTRNRLTSGTVTDCGCEKSAQEIQPEQRFGNLTVLHRMGRRWRCRCVCGRELAVSGYRLKHGQIQSCGCLRHGPSANRRNLAGQTFGRLTAVRAVPGKGKSRNLYWHCICECGTEVDVLASHLMRGEIRSCGCRRREQSARRHQYLPCETGSPLESLAQGNTEDSTPRSPGVRQISPARWRATISFHRVHYSLGCYGRFEEAAEARKKAEAALHVGYRKSRAAWEAKAEEDPQWGENNPFFYEVEYERREFRVCTNGEMP